jgi:hypothetical protein
MSHRSAGMITQGEALAFRLIDANPWRWSLVTILRIVLTFAMILVLVGIAVGSGILTGLLFRSTTGFRLDQLAVGLMTAVATVAIGVLAIWLLLAAVGDLITEIRVGPTVVEVSDHLLHPGQTFEVMVAQAGPLQSRHWRIVLVGTECSVSWGPVPDPLSGQGEILQAFQTTRPLSTVLIAQASDLKIPAGEVHQERRTARVPEDAVVSSWSRERAVSWRIEVQGDINGWPRFSRRFAVTMAAAPVAAK